MCFEKDPASTLIGLSLATSLVITLASCGATDDEDSGEPTDTGVSSSSSDSTPPGEQNHSSRPDEETPELGDSALEEMTVYVMDMINAAEPSEASDWEDRLDESFVAELSVEEFSEFINQQVQSGAPWSLEQFAPASEHAAVSVIDSSEGRYSMELSIDPDTELLNAIVFNPLPQAEDSVESLDELTSELDRLPVDVAMLVVEDGETLYERDAQQVMPLSSTSKLYVLHALAQSIADGQSSWEDTLTVTDELRSLPSGDLQDEAAGYELNVADTALKMISASDNTATDMIIDYLGRETVEDAVVAAAHHDPSLLTPYLSTGNLFHLRWADPDLGQRYFNADVGERRSILESLDGETLELDPIDVRPGTGDEESLEWYATAEDVVAVHQSLQDLQGGQPELARILAANPGLTTNPDEPWWDEIAYKGGSTLEVLSGSWNLTGSGTRERTVAVLVRGDDPSDVQSLQGTIFGLAQDAFVLEE